MSDLPNEHDERADDLAALRAIRSRVQTEDVGWARPPADLWDRIAEQAGVAAGPTGPSAEEPTGAPVSFSVPQPSTGRRPARRRLWLLAAAAAVLVVVGSVFAVNRSAKPSVVASAALERLGQTGRGDAELVKDHGKLRLRVHTAGVDAGDGFLEVWVIDPGVSRLVSLGPLRSDGVYDLPSGLEPRKFPIVDVSVEPLDGNPAHSSDSVLRGRLRF